MSRKREWPLSDQVFLGLDLERTRLELRLDLAIAGSSHEEFYNCLTELLWSRHSYFVPSDLDPSGGQASILEMALERNYTMYGFDSSSPDVRLAKAIAPLLPRLGFSMPDPAGAPARLGWLNYWNEQVVAKIGFPDAEKDARLLSLCRRLPSGAWIVKLTEDPLDLLRPDHVDAITRAYWRFDGIGKRMKPTAKSTMPRARRSEIDAAVAEGLNLYVLRERDANGQWWDSAVLPISAASAEDALRVYFARNSYSRKPKRGESLAKLRDAYNEIAVEANLPRGEDVIAVQVDA